MTLDDLDKGKSCKIVGYDSDTLPNKFYDLGLLPGCKLTLCRRAFREGPLYVQCEDCNLIMRKQEACKILIEEQE